MIRYSSLVSRKMNREIRISYRNATFVGLSTFLLFVYAISGKKECDTANFSKLESNDVGGDERTTADDKPTIYAVTPTYARPEQQAELVRLSHLFRIVENLFWVIVEDAEVTSALVRNVVNRSGLSHRSVILHAKTPQDFKLSGKDPHWSKPRGVEQRNHALDWVRRKIRHEPGHALVFFMDDDNSYSVELFEEMSKIERGRVGVWPVGLVGGLKVEKPIVEGGKVIGFNSVWHPERPFPIDMAGFAISCDLLEKYPEAVFSYAVQKGYQESEILRHVTTRDKLQPISPNRILIWHTRTEKTKLTDEEKLKKRGLPPSDEDMIV